MKKHDVGNLDRVVPCIYVEGPVSSIFVSNPKTTTEARYKYSKARHMAEQRPHVLEYVHTLGPFSVLPAHAWRHLQSRVSISRWETEI